MARIKVIVWSRNGIQFDDNTSFIENIFPKMKKLTSGCPTVKTGISETVENAAK
jgi:hypothetical protein